MSVVVQIVSACKHPSPEDLTIWAETTRTSLSTSDHREIVIRLVDQAEMIQLNTQYRGKSGPTNVLSFPTGLPVILANGADAEEDKQRDLELPLGDIVICAPIVALESKEQNKPLAAHWCHMVTHGVLHLYGYDHIKSTDATIMETLETKILAKLGFPDPYIAIKH